MGESRNMKAKKTCKVGRPSKFSPAVVKRICGMIGRGLNYSQAAEAAAIHRDTLNEWAKRNSEFSDALKRAAAEGIDRRLRRIEQAARSGNWQADAWWLERVCREQFARYRYVLTVPEATPAHHPGRYDVTKLSAEKRKQLA
jgi:hypothetical protein